MASEQRQGTAWSGDRRREHDLRRAMDRIADDVLALAGARALRTPDLALGPTTPAPHGLGDLAEILAPLLWVLRDVVGIDDLQLCRVADAHGAAVIAPVHVDDDSGPVAVLTCSGVHGDAADTAAVLERAAVAAGDLVRAARQGTPAPFERVRSGGDRSSIPFEPRRVVDVTALAAHLRTLAALGEDHEVVVDGTMRLWTDRPALATLLEHVVALAVRRSGPGSTVRVVLGARSIVVEEHPGGATGSGPARPRPRPDAASRGTVDDPDSPVSDSLAQRRLVRECASRLGAHVQVRLRPDGGRAVTITMPVRALV